MVDEKESTQMTDEDLRAALKEMKTYVDITEEDLKKIYEIARRHARQRIASRVEVKEVMTKNVFKVKRDADLHEAAQLLADNRISGMPVVDDENRVIGVISEADLLVLVGMKKGHTFKDILHNILGDPLRSVTGGRVGDFMSTPALTIGPAEDIRNAAAILDARRIKRLPVVDVDGTLIGIIARADIVRTIGKKV
ncbi:MAG: CBS domain-containing protein [Syntrophales bacterium]